MNRFRARKKAKDDAAVGRISSEEQSSLSSFKAFRRAKKSHDEEQKKAIDLSTALPPSDDFRTSLLMTGLSARFSMLREQDDPSTKIGKASDDSVLYPNRQSRMADFGLSHGLADIAEVESIRATAPYARIGSFASDDADFHQGSIMNRSKPTEGNNLFGGRQIIYKIPVGASAKGTSNLLGGRALYEDDVALSAFQKWRQSERSGRHSGTGDGDDAGDERGYLEVESNSVRPESPPALGYNQRRETSSTTSSVPSLARNSTAATSIASQPPQSLKDWQPQGPLPTSSASTPTLERHVMRTRRLYEQGLTQDLHDQQSSALSRIDTLSRQRPLGSRTPDLTAGSPSPTGHAFSERFSGDRRHILTKASAPNLRSISPPATGSSIGTMDLGMKPPSWAESRSSTLETPPLSPPASEPGEHPLLAIQPNDRGKATAMGVFQKPSLPYDESKFAQRQVQLQQGRDTPTQRFRAESNGSFSTNRSRSSSAQRHRPDATARLGTAVQEENSSEMSFYIAENEEEDEAFAPAKDRTASRVGPSQGLERPADHEHPALRQTAASSSLTLSREGRQGSKGSAPPKLELSLEPSGPMLSEDSPTLGPGAGLSGMVRQHLRSESNASSIYGGLPQSGDLDSQFPIDPRDSQMLEQLGVQSNPWQDRAWRAQSSSGGVEMESDLSGPSSSSAFAPAGSPEGTNVNQAERAEQDEFASQLAQARRRVQERLTSYVDSDSSRAPSPLPSPEPSKTNPFGMLRSKSSRGSLADRSRDNSQTKAMKMLGIGASTMTTSPSPSKQSFDVAVTGGAPGEATSAGVGSHRDEDVDDRGDGDGDVDPRSSQSKEDDNVHPGLRAFRQARRELQKRKELETLARHQSSAQQEPLEAERAAKAGDTRRRAPSNENRPLAAYDRARTSVEDSTAGTDMFLESNSRPSSKSDHERSGSEASMEKANTCPPRLRKDSSCHEDQQRHLATQSPSRAPMLRSPGLPGTDIRRSPYMPPQGYPGGSAGRTPSSRHHIDSTETAANLTVLPSYPGMDANRSGQASPISPLHAGPLASTFSVPHPSGRRPSLQNSSATTSTPDLLVVKSTQRVPTGTLAQSQSSPGLNREPETGLQSRSGSNTGFVPPPLPPLNPLRKRESPSARGAIAASRGFNGEGESASSMRSPQLPFVTAGPDRKAGSGQSSVRSRINNPPFVAGPPASRAVVTSTVNKASKNNMGVPGDGGMI